VLFSEHNRVRLEAIRNPCLYCALAGDGYDSLRLRQLKFTELCYPAPGSFFVICKPRQKHDEISLIQKKLKWEIFLYISAKFEAYKQKMFEFLYEEKCDFINRFAFVPGVIAGAIRECNKRAAGRNCK
jgi:hypothetical protein